MEYKESFVHLLITLDGHKSEQEVRDELTELFEQNDYPFILEDLWFASIDDKGDIKFESQVNSVGAETLYLCDPNKAIGCPGRHQPHCGVECQITRNPAYRVSCSASTVYVPVGNQGNHVIDGSLEYKKCNSVPLWAHFWIVIPPILLALKFLKEGFSVPLVILTGCVFMLSAVLDLMITESIPIWINRRRARNARNNRK